MSGNRTQPESANWQNHKKETTFDDPIPRIPLDLRAHKLAIAIPWVVIVSTGGIIPIIGYFSLRYTIHPPETISLSPWLALFGVSSLYNMGFRLWSLTKKSSTCRPIGSPGAWALDFFQWHFMITFIGLNILIPFAIARKQVRLASIPLALLMAYISTLLLIASLGAAVGLRNPCRISSCARGEPLKAGTLSIAEDVIAVDAKQALQCGASFEISIFSGGSGVFVAAAIFAIVFAVPEESVGYAVGYSVPWIWGGLTAVVTIRMVHTAKREEEGLLGQSTSP